MTERATDLYLITRIRSPLHRRAPHPAFNSKVVGFIAQVGAQSAVPVSAHLVLEIPLLHLEYSHTARVLCVTISATVVLVTVVGEWGGVSGDNSGRWGGVGGRGER